MPLPSNRSARAAGNSGGLALEILLGLRHGGQLPRQLGAGFGQSVFLLGQIDLAPRGLEGVAGAT